MSHQAVRTFIADVARSLDSRVQFEYGTPSDVNSKRNKDVPLFYLNLLRRQIVPNQNYVAIYPVDIIIYMHDNPSGAEEETQKVLDEVDKLVYKFVHILMRADIDGEENPFDNPTTQSIDIPGSIDVVPFVKQTEDVLTGFGLTFQMVVPDNFDYCSIYDTSS